MESQEQEKMLNKKEVAEFLTISVRTVERLMQRGELPFHKIGKNVRFKRVDVEEYLKKTRK